MFRHRLLTLLFLLAVGPPLLATTSVSGVEREDILLRFVGEWGRKGSQPGEFHFPIGIAINAADEVLVTDFYNARVQRFSVEGQLLAVLPVLPNPGGIAVGRSGEIYLTHFAEEQKAEKTPARMSVYDHTGKLLREWGRTGKGGGEFDYPGGIAIS